MWLCLHFETLRASRYTERTYSTQFEKFMDHKKTKVLPDTFFSINKGLILEDCNGAKKIKRQWSMIKISKKTEKVYTVRTQKTWSDIFAQCSNGVDGSSTVLNYARSTITSVFFRHTQPVSRPTIHVCTGYDDINMKYGAALNTNFRLLLSVLFQFGNACNRLIFPNHHGHSEWVIATVFDRVLNCK